MPGRKRTYLMMMGVCLTLFVLAGTVVRLFSTTLALVMFAVALVIPPLAVIIANRGGGRDE
ncbi:DUF3099 domain-containing protein [Microbispora sp. ATCC PTA-5024]|uniref:DUF3099 domain-containing protein n=1 Tax=Microbispora sp. ATCC PTA-5024 TaxID=316330 RepID=UPI0003DC7029|nr:DUF3099 domain-containing protein [Microbispora sp. ATCC PTA-5024]ETK31431.1 membrane protein [Microbispora sp. ATCC PTA-5024]